MAAIGFDRQWLLKMPSMNSVIDRLSRVEPQNRTTSASYQLQLQPALLRLSAIISQSFTSFFH
jgi:hypothetical protein